MRISDWSSDVCSSDLILGKCLRLGEADLAALGAVESAGHIVGDLERLSDILGAFQLVDTDIPDLRHNRIRPVIISVGGRAVCDDVVRSEEHTSELQSLMRITYAVFCLKKKHKKNEITQ